MEFDRFLLLLLFLSLCNCLHWTFRFAYCQRIGNGNSIGRQFTCTIWDRPVVVADGHFPYSQSYRCQRYCCMTRIALRRQAAVLQLMTMKSAMAIVVAAMLEAASDSYRKRSMDSVRSLGPFLQIAPTSLLMLLLRLLFFPFYFFIYVYRMWLFQFRFSLVH